eukprot:TRINITY_DN5248_c0_g1_i1.p2 TRINITY_DN5248_c0_g1~~TRINITY_DN5248_c0_g1_i1.p2  ORF type:complete len:103 (-),score=7.43 TRINITY_DN5248_c0_g1_i1:132-440(-)
MSDLDPAPPPRRRLRFVFRTDHRIATNRPLRLLALSSEQSAWHLVALNCVTSRNCRCRSRCCSTAALLLWCCQLPLLSRTHDDVSNACVLADHFLGHLLANH